MIAVYEYGARVVRVIDGDSFHADIDLGFKMWLRQTVRVAGIDAPEKGKPGGAEARKFLEGLLPEYKLVQLKTSKPDKYGRVLAEVTVNGQSLAQALVAAGHAKPYRGGKRA